MKKFWDWLTGNDIDEIEASADLSSAALILMGHYVQPLGCGSSHTTKDWFFRPKNATIGTYVTDRGLIEIAKLYSEASDSCKDEAVMKSNMIKAKLKQAKIKSEDEVNKPFYHPYTQEELEEKGWQYSVGILQGPLVAKEVNNYRVEITSDFIIIFDDGAWVKYPVKFFSDALDAATALLRCAE